jgi:L-rhamnose-H+ transport protein
MGSIVPLLRQHHDQLLTRAGLTSLTGIFLVLVGVAVSAIAGRIRDQVSNAHSQPNPHFIVGMIMAIASGICASMMNVGFSYGALLASAAAKNGANTLWTANAIWVPLLAGGMIPNLVYSAYLLKKRRTAILYRSQHIWMNSCLALGMAILWFGSSVLYGAATMVLGALGPVVGWPLFMSLIVIVASLLGIWTGEWKHATRRALPTQMLAVAILVAAVIVLSRAAF